MRNYQKGFIAPLVIILAFILISGAGAYFFVGNAKKDQSTQLPTTVSTTTAPITQTSVPLPDDASQYRNDSLGFSFVYPKNDYGLLIARIPSDLSKLDTGSLVTDSFPNASKFVHEVKSAPYKTTSQSKEYVVTTDTGLFNIHSAYKDSSYATQARKYMEDFLASFEDFKTPEMIAAPVAPTGEQRSVLSNPSALHCGTSTAQYDTLQQEATKDTALKCFGERINQCLPTTVAITNKTPFQIVTTVGIENVNGACMVSSLSIIPTHTTFVSCPSLSQVLQYEKTYTANVEDPGVYAYKSINSLVKHAYVHSSCTMDPLDDSMPRINY